MKGKTMCKVIVIDNLVKNVQCQPGALGCSHMVGHLPWHMQGSAFKLSTREFKDRKKARLLQ